MVRSTSQMIGLLDVLRFEIHQEHDGTFVQTLSPVLLIQELELEEPFPVATCGLLVGIRP